MQKTMSEKRGRSPVRESKRKPVVKDLSISDVVFSPLVAIMKEQVNR